MDATNLFESKRLVPVVVIEDESIAVDLAKTLVDAGIGAIEITLRTENALAAIELVANQVTDIVVGAGSVRRSSQFEEIIARGARFAVSPGATDQLISAAKRNNMPFVPGAATASEVLSLMEHGYRLQKFFPAQLSGGIAMLKALSAPLPEVRFFPTGGIDADLARDYLDLNCVNCIGGSWFVPSELLADREFGKIGQLAASAVQICHD